MQDLHAAMTRPSARRDQSAISARTVQSAGSDYHVKA